VKRKKYRDAFFVYQRWIIVVVYKFLSKKIEYDELDEPEKVICDDLIKYFDFDNILNSEDNLEQFYGEFNNLTVEVNSEVNENMKKSSNFKKLNKSSDVLITYKNPAIKERVKGLEFFILDLLNLLDLRYETELSKYMGFNHDYLKKIKFDVRKGIKEGIPAPSLRHSNIAIKKKLKEKNNNTKNLQKISEVQKIFYNYCIFLGYEYKKVNKDIFSTKKDKCGSNIEKDHYNKWFTGKIKDYIEIFIDDKIKFLFEPYKSYRKMSLLFGLSESYLKHNRKTENAKKIIAKSVLESMRENLRDKINIWIEKYPELSKLLLNAQRGIIEIIDQYQDSFSDYFFSVFCFSIMF
jgi:hypothetical protein